MVYLTDSAGTVTGPSHTRISPSATACNISNKALAEATMEVEARVAAARHLRALKEAPPHAKGRQPVLHGLPSSGLNAVIQAAIRAVML